MSVKQTFKKDVATLTGDSIMYRDVTDKLLPNWPPNSLKFPQI